MTDIKKDLSFPVITKKVENILDSEKHQYNLSNRLSLPLKNDSLSLYISKVRAIPSLTQEEELLLATNYIEKKDVKAAHKLVMSHLKLVVKLALKYANDKLPMLDIISEGNIGLLRAVEKYDPSLGYRFSTYAMWWIKANIQEYILKSWSLVKVIKTSRQKNIFLALRKLKKRIPNVNFNSYEEEYKKIAQEFNVSLKDVLLIESNIGSYDVSLNDKISWGESQKELIDNIQEKSDNQEVVLIKSEEKKIKKDLLLSALKILDHRELFIIKKRKLSENPMTLNELSKKFSISKERVRQIENNVFCKIRDYVLSASNKLFLLD